MFPVGPASGLSGTAFAAVVGYGTTVGMVSSAAAGSHVSFCRKADNGCFPSYMNPALAPSSAAATMYYMLSKAAAPVLLLATQASAGKPGTARSHPRSR